MEQYIPKSALVAEIERRQRKLCVLSQSSEAELRKNAAMQNGVYCNLLSFIDTLEVKEVDLEKEMDKYFDEHDEEFCRGEYLDFAKHFFELGLKAIHKESKI